MKLRGIIALALALACSPVAAQTNPGTSPLSVPKGGTGASSLTAHGFLLGQGTGPVTSLLCGSAQLAVGQSAADPICRTITGDVTIDAGGVTAIGTAKVTYAKMQNVSGSRLLGNPTGSAAAPSEISLDSTLNFSGSTLRCTTFGSSQAGCAPASGGGISNFLRADGAWAAPSGSAIQVFNPLDYGAVGNGTTDDTTAWNNLCAAVTAAGSGWIWSPPGKTYRVFTNYSAANQVLCRISSVKGLRVTMNGSQIVSHYVAQVVMGGTGTTGDTIAWTFSSWVGHVGFPVTVTVPMATGYTPATMATLMASSINGNSTLAAANITATAVGNAVNINDIGLQVGWYTGNSSGASGLVVTGAKTETMSVSPLYGILIDNSTSIIIDDFTANAYSGYADSTRNQTGQMTWLGCGASGAASPAFGCRNAQFNAIYLSGCSNAVAIGRAAHLSDWSRNLRVNGYVENCGYGASIQSDGMQAEWRLTTFNVGRALIAYNTSGVKAWINDSRNRDLGLNSVDIGAVGLVGDISNSTTSDIWVDYKFSLTGAGGTYPTTFFSITHTQGETATSNIITHVDNIHFNFDITIPTGATSGLISELSFIGNATSQTPGEVLGNTELGNTLSGVWNGAGTGASFGCIMSNAGSCSGYGSNNTTATWTIRDMWVADTRPWNIGGNRNRVQFSNYTALGQSVPTVDAASPSINLVYQAPTTFTATVLSGVSCTSSSTVTVLRGAVQSC